MASSAALSFPSDPELERVFQAPARLRIMAALLARTCMDFGELVELLHLTRGNLSVHMKVLDEAGLVTTTKKFVANRPRTTYHITPTGRAAFERYAKMLERIVETARQKGVSS